MPDRIFLTTGPNGFAEWSTDLEYAVRGLEKLDDVIGVFEIEKKGNLKYSMTDVSGQAAELYLKVFRDDLEFDSDGTVWNVSDFIRDNASDTLTQIEGEADDWEEADRERLSDYRASVGY